MVNLQTLEQICHRLASYLESNEIANVEELSRVQLTLAKVFPNSVNKPFIREDKHLDQPSESKSLLPDDDQVNDNGVGEDLDIFD